MRKSLFTFLLFFGLGLHSVSARAEFCQPFLTAQPSLRLRIATYNLMNKYAPQALLFPSWSKRLEGITNWVLREHVDVLATQEALGSMIKDLQRNLPDYQMVGRPRSDRGFLREYAAIFFRRDRFELLDSGHFWLSKTPDIAGSSDWGAANVRMATWVELRPHGSEDSIFIFNAHFDHLSAHARVESAKLLKIKASQIAADRPVLLAGDLNVDLEDEALVILRDGFFGARLSSLTPPTGPTNTYGLGESFLNWELDHVFASAHWKACGYAVHEPRTSQGRSTSDHRPVVVDYAL